ncbi:MAG: OmpH family outer membrane protein [Verrucomicrobiales bacterium]
MNKHISRPLLTALCLGLLSLLQVQAQDKPKVATVDMGVLLNEYHETKAAQAQDREEKQKIQAQDQERLENIKELDTELKKLAQSMQDPSLAEDKRKQLLASGQEKQQTLVNLQRERQESTQRRINALKEHMVAKMQDIRKTVIDRVNSYGEANGFDYVFDSTGQSTNYVPFLLYIRDKEDITAAVLKDLNKDAPAAPAGEEAPAAEEKPAE